MQKKVDTKGHIIKGLRQAVKQIAADVRCRELYFVYFDLISREVLVDVPGGASPARLLVMESGVYNMTQQELADLIIDVLTKKGYT